MGNGNRIIQGAREALTIASGEMPQDTYVVHISDTVDVKSIREKLRMVQADFASKPSTVKRVLAGQ